MNVRSHLSSPEPSINDPLLPFEQDQLARLQNQFDAAPARIKTAFIRNLPPIHTLVHEFRNGK